MEFLVGYIFIQGIKILLKPPVLLLLTGVIFSYRSQSQTPRRIMFIGVCLLIALVFSIIESKLNAFRITFLNSRMSIDFYNIPNEMSSKDIQLYALTYIPSLIILFALLLVGLSILNITSFTPFIFSLSLSLICIFLYSADNFVSLPSYNINGRPPISEKMFDIHSASQNGDIDKLKSLIENGSDINRKTNKNMAPLHISIISNKVEVTEFLINAGADVNLLGDDFIEHTPLMFASAMGDIQTVELLLNKGADPHRQIKNGNNVLYYSKEYLPIINLFVKHGVDYKNINQYGESILSIAARMENDFTPHPKAYELVTYLLDLGLSADGLEGEKTVPLIEAVKASNPDVVNLLLESGAKYDDYGQFGSTALLTAVNKNSPDIVKALLKHGSDARIEGRTFQHDENISPLKLARYKLEQYSQEEENEKTRSIINLLIEYGAE